MSCNHCEVIKLSFQTHDSYWPWLTFWYYNVFVVHNHKCNIDLYGYNSKPRYKNITPDDAVQSYNDSQTVYASVLLINQTIVIPSIFSCCYVVCPIQCHLNSVHINDMSNFLLENHIINDHFVIIPSDKDKMHLCVPFKLQGVTSYIPVRAET